MVAADPLLAAAHQVDGLEPDMQQDLAVLENDALADRELPPAVVALAQAVPDHPLRVLLAGLRPHAL